MKQNVRLSHFVRLAFRLLLRRLDFLDGGAVLVAHDEDGEAGRAVEVAGAQGRVVEFPAEVGIAVFVEGGHSVHVGEDFDIHFAERLFVAGVRDLEAAEAFADLDVEFVGVGGFGFGQASAGDFRRARWRFGILWAKRRRDSRRRGA